MQHQLAINYQSPSGTVSNVLTATGDANIELNLTIAPAASSAETDVAIVSTNLQAFYICATAAMTVVCKSGTGGSGTTEATFTLVANVPQFWVTGNGSNPFGGNVGQLLVTSTPGGTLNVRALLND